MPIGHQLFLMQFRPCQYKSCLLTRKVAFYDLTRAYVNGRPILVVVRMEMRSSGEKYIRMMIPKNIEMVGIVFFLPLVPKLHLGTKWLPS
jgi:hypothetical protein